MRALPIALALIACFVASGCPKKSEPVEPVPPPADAAVDAPPTPMQTPQASTAIRASAYPQHCTRDDECIGVFEGDACSACRCAFNAIRVDAFAKYKADLGAFWACHKPDDCKTECHQDIGVKATCQDGTCILPP